MRRLNATKSIIGKATSINKCLTSSIFFCNFFRLAGICAVLGIQIYFPFNIAEFMKRNTLSLECKVSG